MKNSYLAFPAIQCIATSNVDLLVSKLRHYFIVYVFKTYYNTNDYYYVLYDMHYVIRTTAATILTAVLVSVFPLILELKMTPNMGFQGLLEAGQRTTVFLLSLCTVSFLHSLIVSSNFRLRKSFAGLLTETSMSCKQSIVFGSNKQM